MSAAQLLLAITAVVLSVTLVLAFAVAVALVVSVVRHPARRQGEPRSRG